MSDLVRKLDWSCEPIEAVARWPRGRALAALCSGSPEGSASRWARWSILAVPERVVCIESDEQDPIGRMFEHVRSTAKVEGGSHSVPFVGGWMVALSYELGRVVEPRSAIAAERRAEEWPWSIVMWRCPAALAFDHGAGEWWSVGGERGPAGQVRLRDGAHEGGGYAIGEPEQRTGRREFERKVARAVEYIRAGDVFEVNLSHRLCAACSGSARAMFLDLYCGSSPWYGAYLEVAQEDRVRFALSASPELFLEFDARTRRVTTRPIKGTRAGDVDPAALRGSEKDQAELNMIVDLMRNDLGRVSGYGTVRVSEARAIERHALARADHDAVSERPGVLHGVATIEGTLRNDADLSDLLRSTFPAGSITGAPKVRAMQIIEEMEPGARGLYTGAIGYISDCGNMSLNVAIRTCVISGRPDAAGPGVDQFADGTLSYGVGAGIVADSDPEAEFAETMDKAGVLMSLAEASRNHA